MSDPGIEQRKDAYASAGVDQSRAHSAVGAIVATLERAGVGGRDQLVPAGHYAAVIATDSGPALALATDGVGSKLVVAEQLGRFDTVGVDCVAMNVNDVVCVGARPIAFLDYVAVERPDPEMLGAVARGIAEGAARAGVVVPGGELAVVPDLIRGHPSPRGLDLVGFCVGTVEHEDVLDGQRIAKGNVVIGLPSNGVHANGLTLARKVLPKLDERPAELDGRTVGEVLLDPTEIYVRCALDLLDNLEKGAVTGFAHITGDGMLNLLRLGHDVGYRIDQPLARPAIFDLIAARGAVSEAEMWEVFNMGCGFCVIADVQHAEEALSLARQHYPQAAIIGEVTDRAGQVEIPAANLVGDRKNGFYPAS